MGDPVYPASRLDANQVLTHSFDEATQRIRVTSDATVVNADIDVSLDPLEDGVFVADKITGDKLVVNPNGSINVVVSNSVTDLTLYSQYAEITGVGMGVTSLIASYSITAATTLQKIEYSGTNIAEYELVIDGATQDKRRTYFGSSLNGEFNFDEGLKLVNSQSIEIYVVHYRPTVGDFNIRIQTLG